MASIVRPMAARGRASDGNGGVSYGARDLNYEYRREFGAFLRGRRLELGLTQQEVGQQLGVGLSAVSGMEIGRIALAADKAEAMAEILKMEKDEFGRLYLRWSNPWVYKLIFNSQDRRLLEDIASIPSRVGVNPALSARTRKP
jgi:transcriptional regulator with XRE-family HTH domain